MDLDGRGFAAHLLAVYASTFKTRDDIADLAERGRWVLFATVANTFVTGLFVIVVLLELN